MINIRPDEISNIIRQQIESYDQEVKIDNVGTVLQIGDGIARVYGLDQVQAGEMVEFPGGVKGMALNLESDNVGIVIFGSDQDIKEGDTVSSGDVVADVETDKATMEMPVFDDGKILKLLVPAGQQVKVGTQIALILEDGESLDGAQATTSVGAPSTCIGRSTKRQIKITRSPSWRLVY